MMGKTAGKPVSYNSHDRFAHVWRAKYERLSIERDKLNEEYPVGTFVRYWYHNDKDWNSTFGFISRPFYIERPMDNFEDQCVCGCVLPIGIHKTWINKGEQRTWEENFDIYGVFGGLEKVTMEEYYAYARVNLIKGIRDDQENLRSIKRSIKDYRHKKKILEVEMQKQATRALKELENKEKYKPKPALSLD